MLHRFVLGLTAVLFAGSAIAQEGNWMVTVPPRKPAAQAPAGSQGPMLKAGTQVALRLSDPAQAQKLGVGQRVPLVVASDVRVGHAIVIPAGATAEGEITALSGKKVAAKALYVRVNGKTVRLAGDLARSTLSEDFKLTN